jgi:two-component system KDP operon response regulator KdpE
MSQRILIIDDDHQLLALLTPALEQRGFIVDTAQDGKAGVLKASETPPDLIILDIVMPHMDGWSVFRQLREVCPAPIIVFTAMVTTQGIGRALLLGVDVFVAKPCGLEELNARILEALARRAPGARPPPALYDDGYLRIDPMQGATVRRDEGIDLTPTECRLLVYLARRQGQTASYQELLVSTWGPEYAEETSFLDLYVQHLRQKIEPDQAHPRYIHRRPGEGYCFVGAASPVLGTPLPIYAF